MRGEAVRNKACYERKEETKKKQNKRKTESAEKENEKKKKRKQKSRVAGPFHAIAETTLSVQISHLHPLAFCWPDPCLSCLTFLAHVRA